MALSPTVPAGRFRLDAGVQACEPFAGGHINQSYLIVSRSGCRYLLQRLNSLAFPDPAAVMRNVTLVAEHLARPREGAEPSPALRLVPALEGGAWYTAPDGAVWRMFQFIENATTCSRVRNAVQARETGRAFGAFARMLADYAGPPLAVTLPGFHDTPARLRALEAAAARDAADRARRAAAEIAAVLGRRALAAAIPEPGSPGGPPVRIAHYDAKIGNVLFDQTGVRALCVVDLDTVMPGTVLYDFGDLVRSATSPTEEDEPDPGAVGVRPGLYRSLAEGYLGETEALLTPWERRNLGTAGRVITLEQAARFLADFLEGDRYYRVADPDQNLRRCRTQLRLLQTLEDRAASLERVFD